MTQHSRAGLVLDQGPGNERGHFRARWGQGQELWTECGGKEEDQEEGGNTHSPKSRDQNL